MKYGLLSNHSHLICSVFCLECNTGLKWVMIRTICRRLVMHHYKISWLWENVVTPWLQELCLRNLGSRKIQGYVRCSFLKVFLGKGVLKICSKVTEGHPYWSAISITLLCSFIEIALRHECFPANLLHIFRASLSMSTSKGLLLVLTLSLHIIAYHPCNIVWLV